MHFELDGPDFDVGDRLDVEISLPAGNGVYTSHGRAICRAEIVRVEPVTGTDHAGRLGHAVRFIERLQLSV